MSYVVGPDGKHVDIGGKPHNHMYILYLYLDEKLLLLFLISPFHSF